MKCLHAYLIKCLTCSYGENFIIHPRKGSVLVRKVFGGMHGNFAVYEHGTRLEAFVSGVPEDGLTIDGFVSHVIIS